MLESAHAQSCLFVDLQEYCKYETYVQSRLVLILTSKTTALMLDYPIVLAIYVYHCYKNN